MINPYQGPSLQDILGQDYSSGYAPQPQLGIGDIPQAVPPTAYSTMTAQNPGLADQIQAAIARQLTMNDPRSQQPPDMAYGRESSFGRTNQGVPDDETSAFDVAKSIIGLPFGLLNEGRNFVQDTLGLPGARARQRDADQLQVLQNLPQAQRQLLGIDNISGISTPGANVGDASGTAGAPSSLGQNAGSTMKGFVQWTQNLGRDRAQQTMDQVRMAIKAQYAAGKIGLQEAQRLTELAAGNANAEQSRLLQAKTTGENIHNYFMPAQETADLGVKRSAMGANNAQATASYASARNADARTATEDQTRPSVVGKSKADQLEAEARAQGQFDANYWSGQKGLSEQQKADEDLRQSRDLFPVTRAKGIAEANANVALANQRNNVFGNTGGVGSGTQGANAAGNTAAQREGQIRKDVAELIAGNGNQGRPALDPNQVAEMYDIPMKSGPHWWSSDVPDFRAGPAALERLRAEDSAAAATQRRGTEIPLYPMPSLDSGVSNPIQKPAGQDVYRIHAMLRNAMQGGNEGETLQYAEQLARLLPSLDMSSMEGFARTAVKSPSNPNGVPKEIARAYWNATQNASR